MLSCDASIFLSSPCGGVAGLKLALSTCGGLSLFTRRQFVRHSLTPAGFLPSSSGARGKVRTGWGVEAAGAFLRLHGCSLAAAAVSFYRKS